ncbi:Rha family phage regulatory protein [Serratia microhaemolytica]|uniref:Rha family phage regulatory protein n=1 Tax=Serratia microhaemolytica TaxID=2675110 RepID=UPI000FDE798E|nr:Rha family phage regulatory protein [Serratia microhaemolytica]
MSIQTVDYLNFGSYSSRAAAKSVAGICTPEFVRAHNRAKAVFLCAAQSHRSMVGRAGQPSGWPGSLTTGSANPVRLTTHEICTSGGELTNLSSEAATMATILALAQPEIVLINGQAVTSSLAIADYFGKRHDDVLKKIRSLECSPEFTTRNFAVSEYTDPTGRKLPCYQITRDGFAFLAMGFTGKKAAAFKEAYITAFNQMEQTLVGGRLLALSNTAHNAAGVLSNLQVIAQAWRENLYPMLKAANSPLAVSLYDRVNDAVFGATLVADDLGRKL